MFSVLCVHVSLVNYFWFHFKMRERERGKRNELRIGFFLLLKFNSLVAFMFPLTVRESECVCVYISSDKTQNISNYLIYSRCVCLFPARFVVLLYKRIRLKCAEENTTPQNKINIATALPSSVERSLCWLGAHLVSLILYLLANNKKKENIA